MARRPSPTPVVIDKPPETINLASWSGLVNTRTPERLTEEELQKATNVDIDDAGQIRRRRGFTRVKTENYHSLWKAERGHVFVVKDGDLGTLDAAYNFTGVVGGVGPDPLAYVQVADTIYYASRTTSGQVDLVSMTAAAWGAEVSAGTWHSPVIVPTDTLGEVYGKLIGPPPMAEYLAHLNGRIYLASKRVLWATELYKYNWVDKTRTFIHFEADLTGVVAVSDGLYVGTAEGVWFLTGEFGQMRRLPMTADAVLPGSMLAAAGDDFPPDMARGSKRAALMMTSGGLCVGFDGGVYANMTGDRFWFPEAQAAAAFMRKQDGFTQYVGVTDNRGSPVSSARIGDHVDAEIIRFNGA